MSTLEEKWEDNPDLTKRELREYLAFRARLEAEKEGQFLISANKTINEETMLVSGVLLSRTDWCVFCKTNLLDWNLSKKNNNPNKMKMFVDGCYVQFREFGETVACKNSREKHRAADWANAFPNPYNYICRQNNSVPPHLRPFSIDVPEPEDIDERDDPTFRLTLHYYPERESDYESSCASSTFDSDDSDISAESGTEHGDRKTTRQASSAVEFVKSPESHRSARPQPGAFVKVRKIGVKRKYKNSPEPLFKSSRKEAIIEPKESKKIKVEKDIPSRDGRFEALQYRDRSQSTLSQVPGFDLDELFSEPRGHQPRIAPGPNGGVMHPTRGVHKVTKPAEGKTPSIEPMIKQKRTTTPPPTKPAKKVFTLKEYSANAIRGHPARKIEKTEPIIKRERSSTPQLSKPADKVPARALEGSSRNATNTLPQKADRFELVIRDNRPSMSPPNKPADRHSSRILEGHSESAINTRPQKFDKVELAIKVKRLSIPSPTKPTDRMPARALEGHSASAINARPQKVDKVELAIKAKRHSMPSPTKPADKIPGRALDGYSTSITNVRPQKADKFEPATGINQKRHSKPTATVLGKNDVGARSLDGYSAKALMAYPLEKTNKVDRAIKNKCDSAPLNTTSIMKDNLVENCLGDTLNLKAHQQKVQEIVPVIKKIHSQGPAPVIIKSTKRVESLKEHSANSTHVRPQGNAKAEPISKPTKRPATPTIMPPAVKRVASLKENAANPFNCRSEKAEKLAKPEMIEKENDTQELVTEKPSEMEWSPTKPEASANPLLQLLESETSESQPEPAPKLSLMDMLAEAQRNLDRMTEETVTAFASRGIDFSRNSNNNFSYF